MRTDGIPSTAPVTIPTLQQMKRDGTKIVGVVAWDSTSSHVDRKSVVS